MKALKLIICLLAVTLFVACSKKKDGNQNPYYPNGTYGLMPNDINSGGMYQQPGVMPGYQLPQGCGTGQMFPDALSYCGWLATEGESVCNPMVVKQMFLQYCQSFAVQYNYCVPQVQSGCYYGSGCNFGSTTIRYHDRKRPRDDIERVKVDKIKYGTVYSPAPTQSQAPVYTSPQPTAPNCNGDKNRDCKERYKKSKKSSELICKHPSESKSEENYVYSYSEYLDIIKEECSSKQVTTVTPRTTTYENKPVAQAIPRVEKLGVVYSGANSVPEKLGVVYESEASYLASHPGAKIVARNGQVITSQAATITPAQKVKTVYVLPEDLKKTDTVKIAPKACLNLQKMHEALINPNNHFSSIRIFREGGLLNKTADKRFNTKFVESIKSDKSVYYGNVEGKPSNNLSAIGYNVKQTDTTLRVFTNNTQSGMANSVGKILTCGAKILVAEFKTPYGSERDTFTWNGLMDDDFEIILTRNGTFKSGSLEDSYIMSSYIGVAKNMEDIVKKDDQIIHKKVQADMHEKGMFEEAYKK